MTEHVGVTITLRDVFLEQKATTDRLAAIDVHMANLLIRLEQVDSRNRADDKIHGDFEGRLRALERWRYALPASVFLGLGSAVVTLIEFMLTRGK